jgi:hypothetical protein
MHDVETESPDMFFAHLCQRLKDYLEAQQRLTIDKTQKLNRQRIVRKHKGNDLIEYVYSAQKDVDDALADLKTMRLTAERLKWNFPKLYTKALEHIKQGDRKEES